MGFIIAAAVAAAVIAFCFLCYKKAPPTQAIVVTGFGLSRPKVVCGRGVFVLPIVQRADRLNMRLLKIDVKTPETGVKTKEGVSLWLDSVVTVQVYSENSTVSDEEVRNAGYDDIRKYINSRQQSAISNFLGMDEAHINEKINDVLQGNLREIVSEMTVDQILTNRKQMAVSVVENARPDLAKMGLEVVTFNVQDVKDAVDAMGHNHGVIEAIGVEQEELVKKRASIAKAEAEAKAAKTTADGKNRIFAQMYEPTHSGLRAGDLWYELDRDGHIGSVHVWNGWSFAAYTLVADSLLVPGSVDGGVLIKDGSIEAKNVHIGNGEILTELLKARKIVTDDVEAGQFRGYVFTGSVFQSSEMEDTGLKLDSASLRMWDSNHNQTVYLDGEGKSNLLTGTFQTRASGHRVRISPDYKSATIGGTETFVGDGLEFPAYDSSNGAYHSFPAVASVVQSDEVGTMSAMNLWSGHVNKNDPAAFMRLNSKPRERGGTGSGGVTSEVFAVANTDYDEPDASKKTSASLVLSGDSANGSNAWLRAQDANGTVGVGANIATGYLHLGGFLGGVTNRFTFRGAVAWKAWWPNSGSTIATGASTQVNCTFSPTKYGHYYVVANADSDWAGIIAHPVNTGGQSGFVLKLYNADQPCPVGVWAEYLAYLVK